MERQLKIKTGSLTRNQKDYLSYAKEKVMLEEKLEKLKQQEEVDESKVKYAETELAETIQMLPNCKTRVEGAIEALESFMATISAEAENEPNKKAMESEDWTKADDALKQVKEWFETI
uniref:Tubulin-specific chaperone A n=1 Tax=Strombidinopsis acuminata TaxID=141414 RepID=A0A7S3THD9_9SPIT|mmetsp:Transcript_66533/g.92126  ORF Transcript_66533/g.92126 Transcript_66533/m.92126 type:complete len:118 (+) Transcript_66533:32-385(+)|eukprot:CAMPEP_0176356040 /NCGR_PEP_ID=MMETSP0126-20121128/13733_1 /TAXON_ID=141414 ORGANISM="Strombidinopsis acuminatum, Strain SPMC142" /NCGR_SAMPLE_ID=MMETSP0126 /ASSEMBLY_ACC=CAM_ASM_000229 /LENGTH=117 /DNA_ID=CAMNT_0017708965 /DNA_START=32 /DNA_END=385 /DNA_ORIENTATION=-